MRWRKRTRAIAAAGVVLIAPVVLFVGLDAAFPLPPERLHPPSSTVVLDREGELLRAFLAPDGMWRLHVEAGEVSPVLKMAVVTYEDRRFNGHPGIDPVAVVRAAWANARAGRVVQGASTLTMQLARMIEPKERTLGSKLMEAFRALQIEWHFSKEDILTLYLNHAPYGGNLVGVGAAARFYFDKPPNALTLGEAALLASIPNDPNSNRPDLNPSSAREARTKVLRLLSERGVVTPHAVAEAYTEPIPHQRFDLPFVAPHLAVQLTAHRTDAERLETTVDARLQRLAAEMLADHTRPLLAQGVTNGAVVVLDNRTLDVLALVGSRDFFDAMHDGQVNGTTAPRSPGSALKPFVYALGFDRGLVAPRSLLFDIPTDFSGYRPENYDRTYSGVVSAEDALVRSLNVPAVRLAYDLGGDAMYTFLQNGGVSTLTKPSYHYGLALVLGGAEVSLLDLTTLYAALANEGRYRPYRLLRDDPSPAPKPLVSPGAAHLITDILSQLRRPELPAVWEWSRDQPKVAWKTGTSYGHRDAWSIGYTPRFTVGVWIGNMDAMGSPALVGAEVAAPLLFGLMKALERDPSARWFLRPGELETRRVCTTSGKPATPFCPSSRDESFLPGTSPVAQCDLHRIIVVDEKTGHRLCSHCRIGRRHREKVVAQWPAEVAGWLAQTGYPLDPIPEHLPSCRRLAEGAPPVIRQPQDGSAYRLRRGIPPEHQQIRLDASVSNGTRTIYWFADGEMIYIGTPTERIFLTPSPGAHTLLCMDDEGRSSQVAITVQ